jgi:hypothetical protein
LINIEEKMSATMNRDGGLDSLEVKGELVLKVGEPEKARLRLALNATEDSNIQFKTHPHVDKSLWASQHTITTKDPAKPFPTQQPVPVLKWRYVTKDESRIPLAGIPHLLDTFNL